MSFKWKEKHMPLFLETYRKHECVWNYRCNDYKKPNVRENGYRLMVADLGIPGLTLADVKAKIKTIRTKYVAELTKIRNSEKKGEVYEPRLFWFKDADAFLRDVCGIKRSPFLYVRSLNTLEQVSSFGNARNVSKDFDLKEEQMTDIEDNGATTPEITEYSSAATTAKSVPNVQNCSKRKHSLNTSVRPIRGVVKRRRQVSDDNKQYPNEFDVFCESLAIQLKKMPLQRAVICQEKLQSVMTQERLFQLSESHTLTLSNSSTYRQTLDTSDSDKTPSPDPNIHSESD